jgi:hypothetical protein
MANFSSSGRRRAALQGPLQSMPIERDRCFKKLKRCKSQNSRAYTLILLTAVLAFVPPHNLFIISKLKAVRRCGAAGMLLRATHHSEDK